MSRIESHRNTTRQRASQLALEDELAGLEGAAALRRGSLAAAAPAGGRIWRGASSDFGDVSTAPNSAMSTPRGSEGGFSVSSGGRVFEFY